MKPYAIFDLDGTILDSMYVWKDAGALFLRERKINAPADLYEQLKAMSLEQAARYLNNQFQLSLSISETIEGIKGVVERQYVEEVQLKPFVREYLQYLQDCKVRMCIATASEYNLVEAALKRLGVWEFFDFILTCTEVGYGKDSPVIFNQAAERWGAQPHEVTVFEDALHAIQTAKAAGFFTIGVYDDSSKEDTNEIKRIADIYVNNLDEVSL